MKLPRRNFLHLAAGAAALPALSRIARAQAYPSRPVHWIVSFAAGGPKDNRNRGGGSLRCQRSWRVAKHGNDIYLTANEISGKLAVRW